MFQNWKKVLPHAVISGMSQVNKVTITKDILKVNEV